MGYDIGCVFSGTIFWSSMGDQFSKSGSRCCNNVFHGYSHDMLCQLLNHPNVIKGMGIEDLETLEHIFSSFNGLAGITRHMSSYHQHVAIDMSFAQWDADKYENIATMLYDNYCQAIDIVTEHQIQLEEHLKCMGLKDDSTPFTHHNLDAFIKDQRETFQTLDQGPVPDVQRSRYVTLLKAQAVIK